MRRSAGGNVQELAAFQDEFARALLAPSLPDDVSPALARLAAQPGFAVYRNTVIMACIDALQLNYPVVSRLVGNETFRATAAIYARSRPPCQPSLHLYGDDFPAFLADVAADRAMPYLPDVARLEQLWTESHIAADAEPVAAAAVASLAPEELAALTLCPHPATRWAWFDGQPVVTLWQCNSATSAVPSARSDLHWKRNGQGEGVLLTRPLGHVEWSPLEQSGCAFLDALAQGGTLAFAAAMALAVDRQTDLKALMAKILTSGALMRPTADAKSTTETRQ